MLAIRILGSSFAGLAMGLTASAFPDPEAIAAFYAIGALFTTASVLDVFSLRRSIICGLIFPYWWLIVFYVSLHGPRDSTR